MKIVIIGNGKVGYSLAEQLSQEAHDVTVVDCDEQSLRRAADALDVMTVKGNGVSAAVLRDAGAAEADLLVACTNQDEVNMLPHRKKHGCRLHHRPHPQPGVRLRL